MTPPWHLAIDIGTSNTAAAHTNSSTGAPEALPLTHTSNLMPSAVYVVDDTTILTGTAATNQAPAAPHAYFPFPKLLVGRATTVTVGSAQVPVSRLLAAIISTVLTTACARHSDAAPATVTLTHPESWAPAQTQVLVDAAAEAGIEPQIVSLMSEPHAAARHYARSHPAEPGTRIGVFDFGGGTLDVAVLVVAGNGTYDVVGADGDPDLGGRSFDAEIRECVLDEVDDTDAWEPVDPSARLRLIIDIQQAKEALSESPSATISIAAEGGTTTVAVTRPTFEDRATPLIDRAVDLAQGQFERCGPVNVIYLTGGSSRIPLLHQRIAALGPIATLDDPKLVVAQGALPAQSSESSPMSAMLSAPSFRSSGAAPRRRWRRAVAAAGLAALILTATAGGLWAWRSHQTTPSIPPSRLVEVATTEEQVLAGVPSPLASQLGACKATDFTDQSAVEFTCQFIDDARLSAQNLSYRPVINIAVDGPTARRNIVGARRGTSVGADGRLLENTARTAAAIVEPAVLGWRVEYANAATGLVASMDGFRDPGDATAFLNRSGLIT